MIYVASRASVEKYPREWRRLRAQGWPINSTWIDEAGEGETACMSALWTRIEAEVRAARGVVLWAEEEDFPLKGAFIEVGMAIGMGKPVAVYTKAAFDNRNYRPFGSWMNHPLVYRASSLHLALSYINTYGVGAAAVPEVTDAMVDAYLQANDAYWNRTDELPTPPNKWRTGTPREATRESLRAALGVAPAQPQQREEPQP